MVAGAAATEVVAGEAEAGRAAGQVIVANKSLVEQPSRARERDILRPVFFVETFRWNVSLAVAAYQETARRGVSTSFL